MGRGRNGLLFIWNQGAVSKLHSLINGCPTCSHAAGLTGRCHVTSVVRERLSSGNGV